MEAEMSKPANLGTFVLGAAMLAAPAPTPAQPPGQDRQHVVSIEELKLAAAWPSETRKADEAAVRQLLSSEAGREALKAARVDYQRVDKALGQVSDEDLAKIAARSREAQADFAASGLTSTLIIAIVLIVVLIVVLSVVF
jgi:CHASE3 domain sensor protein